MLRQTAADAVADARDNAVGTHVQIAICMAFEQAVAGIPQQTPTGLVSHSRHKQGARLTACCGTDHMQQHVHQCHGTMQTCSLLQLNIGQHILHRVNITATVQTTGPTAEHCRSVQHVQQISGPCCIGARTHSRTAMPAELHMSGAVYKRRVNVTVPCIMQSDVKTDMS